MLQYLTHLLPSSLSEQVILGWCRIKGNHNPGIFTARQKVEWESFESLKRRQEYLATRWLVKQLGQHLGVEPRFLELKKDTFGKPFGLYKGKKEYHISIAHTDERVLCGISVSLPVGVDMEPVDRGVPGPLRKRILTSKEQTLLGDVETIRIWTIKESLVKLQGQGMRINLNECAIINAENDQFTATLNNDKRAKICSFRHDGNWLAIAWNC